MIPENGQVLPLLDCYDRLQRHADIENCQAWVGGKETGTIQEVRVSRISGDNKGFFFRVTFDGLRSEWECTIGLTQVIVEPHGADKMRITFVTDEEPTMRWIIPRDLNIFPTLPAEG